MPEPDDVSLVSRAVAGDVAAFELLVTRYERVLFSVARRMLGDYEDARDATQTAFIKAYERLNTFDSRYRFFSWLYRILVNECLNAQRGRRRHEAITPDLVTDGTPLDALERAQRQHRVQQALLRLPFEYRQVIVLRYFADLSYDDIALAAGIPAKTVKSRLYTARQRLMELLALVPAERQNDAWDSRTRRAAEQS